LLPPSNRPLGKVWRDKKPPFSIATFKRAGRYRDGLTTFVLRAERLFYRTKAVFLRIRNSLMLPSTYRVVQPRPSKKSPFFQGIALKSLGYRGYSQCSKVVTSMFNSILSALLLILASPLCLIIALIIKWKNTGPVFYSGIRLGLNKKPFLMYKFRTLPMGLQKKIGAELLSYRHCKLPFFFKLLRDTRLDELPQLYNILKGEMVLIGPRPLRPEIYDKFCKNIVNYDLRFTVKPGLIGYSQLFTPDGSPKRMRSLIDNRSIYWNKTSVSHISLFFLCIFFVVKKLCAMVFLYFGKRQFKIGALQPNKEHRVLDRIKQRNARASIYHNPIGDKVDVGNGTLVDMNEEYLKMKTNTKLDKEKYLLRLRKNVKRGDKVRYKSALCRGYIFRRFELKGESQKYGYVIKYDPLSELSRYTLDQYFLEKSIVPVFR